MGGSRSEVVKGGKRGKMKGHGGVTHKVYI